LFSSQTGTKTNGQTGFPSKQSKIGGGRITAKHENKLKFKEVVMAIVLKRCFFCIFSPQRHEDTKKKSVMSGVSPLCLIMGYESVCLSLSLCLCGCYSLSSRAIGSCYIINN